MYSLRYIRGQGDHSVGLLFFKSPRDVVKTKPEILTKTCNLMTGATRCSVHSTQRGWPRGDEIIRLGTGP